MYRKKYDNNKNVGRYSGNSPLSSEPATANQTSSLGTVVLFGQATHRLNYFYTSKRLHILCPHLCESSAIESRKPHLYFVDFGLKKTSVF